jgi:hypothetical protein
VPEKFIIGILNQLNVEFETQKIFDWAKDKRYDMYFKINDIEFCCEVNGRQHYVESGIGRSLKEEQENDLLKYNLAIKNGINHDNYIIVDARYSNLEWLKENFIKSLKNIFDLSNIDWLKIWDCCKNSIMVEVCDYYNSFDYVSIEDVKKYFNLSGSAIKSYLENGSKIGICKYDKNTQRTKSSKIVGTNSNKMIVQLSAHNELIKVWNSATEASKYYNIDNSYIGKCCKNTSRTYKGFYWMYLSDYEKL